MGRHLGHSRPNKTSLYAHVGDDPKRAVSKWSPAFSVENPPEGSDAKAGESNKPFKARLRRRPCPRIGVHGEHEGGSVHIEEWWQSTLRQPPHRLPSGEELGKLLALLNEAEWYLPRQSTAAQELCTQWHKEHNELAVTARPKRRGKRRALRIGAERLRLDDPVRRMHAWTLQEAGSIDPRPPSLSLTQESVDKVLSSPKLPIQLEKKHATKIIDYLCWELCWAKIVPPNNPNFATHSQRLEMQLEALMMLLFDPCTDFVWVPNPRSRLAHLRQELLDFYAVISRWRSSDAYCAECREIRKSVQSELSWFVARELWPAFAEIFGREDQLPSASDNFMRFAQAFFEQIQFCRIDSRGGTHPFPGRELIRAAIRPLRARW